jgi:hypothetical protein
VIHRKGKEEMDKAEPRSNKGQSEIGKEKEHEKQTEQVRLLGGLMEVKVERWGS